MFWAKQGFGKNGPRILEGPPMLKNVTLSFKILYLPRTLMSILFSCKPAGKTNGNFKICVKMRYLKNMDLKFNIFDRVLLVWVTIVLKLNS